MSDAQEVLSGESRWCVLHGDALEVLKRIPDASIDSCVCDPPAGIAFMNREWDKDKGGRDQWIAWLTGVMAEVFRVLKPGAHAIVWALPRTSHWTGMALENAGFEVRDSIHHLFGSGFPKSLNVSKAIAAAAGVERPVVGTQVLSGTAAMSTEEKGGTYSSGVSSNGHKKEIEITGPATEAAKQWDGWGTALKPSHEIWWLARKPLRGTVAANVQEYGTGALNIDGCRIGFASEGDKAAAAAAAAQRLCRDPNRVGDWGLNQGETALAPYVENLDKGRWPANTLLTHDSSCRRIGTTEVKAHPTWDTPERECEATFTGDVVSQVRHGDGEVETVDVFECVEGCPVLEMDRQSGESRSSAASGIVRHGRSGGIMGEEGHLRDGRPEGHSDSGGASRYFQRFEWSELDDITPFFYSAKPSRAERDIGLSDFRALTGGEATGRKEGSAALNNPRTGAGRNGGSRNVHTTVKSIELMRYLCRLITPPKGVVLDWCCGSGSTGVGAMFEGLRFIGIELNDTEKEPYASIARARLQHVVGGSFRVLPRANPENQNAARQEVLFR